MAAYFRPLGTSVGWARALILNIGSYFICKLPFRSSLATERSFFKPIDDASDASFDESNVEVDEQPQALVGELPIR